MDAIVPGAIKPFLAVDVQYALKNTQLFIMNNRCIVLLVIAFASDSMAFQVKINADAIYSETPEMLLQILIFVQ